MKFKKVFFSLVTFFIVQTILLANPPTLTPQKILSHQGKIVVIYGPSSVGKTVTLKLLQQKFNTSLFDSIDNAYFRVLVPNLKKVKPEAYQQLSKIMTDYDMATGLFTRRYIFKEQASDTDKKKATDLLESLTKDWFVLVDMLGLKKAEEAMFQMAVERAQKGETFFLEITDYDAFVKAMNQLDAYNGQNPVMIKNYFLYISPRHLSQRIHERNKNASHKKDRREERFGTFMFNQLAALVKPKTSPNQLSLGKLDKEDLLKLFEEHYQINLKHFPPVSNDPEVIKKEKLKEEQTLIHDFNLVGTKTIELTPKYPYDLVIIMDDTKKPEEVANIIANHILEQK